VTEPSLQSPFQPERNIETAQKRGDLIKRFEDALAPADDLQDGMTGYLIERALDEARSRQFKPWRHHRGGKTRATDLAKSVPT